MSAAAPTRFPAGFRVRVRDDVRALGPLLVGGSPLRALRLSPAALALVADGVVTVRDAGSAALAGRLVDGNLADPVLSPEGVDPSEVTVVVPVRDRPGQLARCLRLLAPLRVVVVDDASRDPDAVEKVARSAGAEVVALVTNVGPAGARNAGLARVGTPYVAFVDSDVSVSSAVLLRLARHFADSSVALVGPMVASRSRAVPEGRLPRWFERYDERDSSLALGARACSVRPGAAVGWLPSACLVARVSSLRAHGGFDASMRVGEDVDLVWRLVAAGASVRYDPDETASHDTRSTLRGWLGRKVLYGTGGAPLAERHGRLGAPAVMTWTTAAASAAVLLRRPWSVPVAAAGTALGVVSVDRRLPRVPGRHRLAVRLSAQGLGWGVRQESALLLRHWWPLAAAGCVASPSVRRAVGSALVVDAAASVLDARAGHQRVAYAPLSRRLDDLAYGAGLWLGALRSRSVTCLLPRRPATWKGGPHGRRPGDRPQPAARGDR